MGPFKASMCGRDWRKIIASPDIVYALCSPKEQELQLTLSMMSDTGLYKPPEGYSMGCVVAYSLHATRYAILLEELFGLGTDGEQLPLNTKIAGMTLASVFGGITRRLRAQTPSLTASSRCTPVGQSAKRRHTHR
jgi:hypothetical protein